MPHKTVNEGEGEGAWLLATVARVREVRARVCAYPTSLPPTVIILDNRTLWVHCCVQVNSGR